MSICRQRSLVNHSPDLTVAQPLYCNCWDCDICKPRRTTKLIAQALAGKPTRFLTLTVAADRPGSPAEHLQELSKTWRLFVQTFRRHVPDKPFEYLVTVEETKAGQPHLHILLRSPSIPHAVISQWMSNHMDSPIVYIEAVKSKKKTARYVAKYIAKKPAQFGSSKRYWQSTAYVIPDPEREAMHIKLSGKWHMDSRDLATLSYWLENSGFTIDFEDETRLEARAPPYDREYARE